MVIMKLFYSLENYFRNIFQKMEDEKVSVWYYIASFVFIVLLRILLEFSLYKYGTVDLQMALHFSLYYVAVALSAIILLKLLTKEKVSKIGRVVLSAFAILILPIVVDFTISLFHPLTVSPAYVYPNGLLDGVIRFFTFFGPEVAGGGATTGMKIEIAILLVLMFLYLRYKKCSSYKSILGALLFYCILFLSSITPAIIGFIEWISYFWLFVTHGASASIDTNYSEYVFINYFLILNFGLSLILFRLLDKKMFENLSKDVSYRLSRILHYLAMALLGVAFASSNLKGFGNNGLFLVDYIFTSLSLLLSIFCFCIFTSVINNIVDLISDMFSGNRPIVFQRRNQRKFFILMCLCLLFGSLFAIGVSSKAFLILICFTGIYFIYSVPPFRFKKIGFLSKFLIGLNSLLIVSLGYLLVPTSSMVDIHAFNSLQPALPLKYAIFIICFTLPINYIDLKDIAGDKNENIKTLPVLLGLNRAKILVGLFFLFLYTSAYFIFDNLWLLILFTCGGIIQYFIVNRKKYSDALVSYSYLVGMAVLIFFVFRQNL